MLPLNICLNIVSYVPLSKAVYSIVSPGNKFDSTIAVRYTFCSIHSFVWSLIALVVGYSDSLDCILFAAIATLLHFCTYYLPR